MEDEKIIELFFARSETAIRELDRKYGKVCYSISYNILNNNLDAEECVNDAYLGTWNAIPPHRPLLLSSFLGKITRRIAIDKWRSDHAQKRGGGEIAGVLDELKECVAYEDSAERHLEKQMLAQAINDFLGTLSAAERKVFVCRYFYMNSVETVCKKFGYSESKVKSILFRLREKLRVYLQKEGLQ